MSTAYGDLFLVTEVKLRIVWREFTHNLRTTIEGKFAIATMVAAPFLMKSLLVSSALRQASMNEHAGWVVLWTAHLFMMAALVLFVAARTARSLIVDPRDDPLAHYPHARQGLAAFHLWIEIVTATTLMLLALFYLFYGPLVSRLAARPLMGMLLHVIGHTVVALALGAVAYRLTLRALERRPTWGRRIYHTTSFPGVLAFVMIAGGPQLLLDFVPGRIDELHSIFESAGRFYVPVTALIASTVWPGPLLGWLFGVGVAGAIALGAAAPLVRTPSRIVLGEVQGLVNRRFKSVFGGRKSPSTHRVVHGARMFFLKDVLLGPVRSPQGFIRQQGIFLGTVGLAPALAWGAPSGRPDRKKRSRGPCLGSGGFLGLRGRVSPRTRLPGIGGPRVGAASPRLAALRSDGLQNGRRVGFRRARWARVRRRRRGVIPSPGHETRSSGRGRDRGSHGRGRSHMRGLTSLSFPRLRTAKRSRARRLENGEIHLHFGRPLRRRSRGGSPVDDAIGDAPVVHVRPQPHDDGRSLDGLGGSRDDAGSSPVPSPRVLTGITK